MNAAAHVIYDRFRTGLTRFERARRLPDEEPVHLGSAEVIIFGMGRLGTGTYDAMRDEFGERLLAWMSIPGSCSSMLNVGAMLSRGDPTDPGLLGTNGARG